LFSVRDHVEKSVSSQSVPGIDDRAFGFMPNTRFHGPLQRVATPYQVLHTQSKATLRLLLHCSNPR
jgi:hypothetical protein